MFSDRDKDIAFEAIKEVNLTSQIDQRTDTLSGGEMQRVAIARAIAQEAGVILADEPVSNLDPALSHEILDLLVQSSTKHRATLIINLHQPALAKRYVQRIIGLRKGKKTETTTPSTTADQEHILEDKGFLKNTSKLSPITVMWFVDMSFIMAAVDALGFTMLSDALSSLWLWIPNIIASIVVFILGLHFVLLILHVDYQQQYQFH